MKVEQQKEDKFGNSLEALRDGPRVGIISLLEPLDVCLAFVCASWQTKNSLV